MDNIPVWKRVGGWLRRSNKPHGVELVGNLDADGLLIIPKNEHQTDQEEDNSTTLSTHPTKTNKQTKTMEEGFNRLVDVLQSLNDNVIQHRQQSADHDSRLENSLNSLASLPESAQAHQQLLKEMTELLKSQSFSQQQVSEIIKTLPETSRQQVDKLGDITRNLESSLESQIQQAKSLSRFDNSTQSILESSKAQALSMANIGQMIQQSQENLQNMVSKQNRRFTWLIALALTLATASLITLAVIIWNKT